jgi:Tol biopolymer transport system component
VVYRAEDLRLGRTVALKFLAPELSRDPVAKQRFLREARAASALDHPNLCTIHEVGETEDGQIFLAMPCYEGETLRDRIRRGPLALEEAADIASQAAQGLGKAHRNGIVHRDIKPANLMITTDGVVKILDFGLAKLADTTGVARQETGGGTLAYMSPEQTRGDDVDGRSDLWSLGVVLYEMLTGLKPFRADREQAILFAIRTLPPEPLAAVRPGVPAVLERIVQHLLAKNPDDRYPSAEAVVVDLRQVLSPTLGVPAVLTAPPVFDRQQRRRRTWGRSAAAVAVLLLLAGLTAAIVRERHSEAVASRPLKTRFSPLTSEAGLETFPSLAPGGEFFVYAKESDGDADIFWQRTGGGNPRNLTADSPWLDTQPAVSADGERIAFRSEREGGGLFVMGATGESARRLTNAGFNPAWSPDGQALVYATEGVAGPGSRATTSQLWQVDVATTKTRRLETRGDAVQPSWSPHGHRIAYWSVRAGTARREIWTLPAGGGEPRLAVQGGSTELLWCPVWSPDGRDLYFASDRSGAMGLWRVRIDERSGAIRGEPQQVLAPATWAALPSLASDGRIAFVRQQERSNLVRVDLDPAALTPLGPLRPVTRGSRSISFVHAAPDGRWIVYGTALPEEDLFIARADGASPEQLTADRARDRVPRWSGSGRRVVFYSDRGGDGYEAWSWTRAAGLERLTDLPEKVLEPIESPDGSQLVCSLDFRGPFLIDLRKPLEQRRPRPLPVAGGKSPAFGVTSWSPDGQRLAGFDEEGRIVLYSFATRRVEVLAERGTVATWLRDNRTLLFLRGGAIWALDTATRQARPVVAAPPNSTFLWFSVTPDGRELFLVHSRDEADIGMLTPN